MKSGWSIPASTAIIGDVEKEFGQILNQQLPFPPFLHSIFSSLSYYFYFFGKLRRQAQKSIFWACRLHIGNIKAKLNFTRAGNRPVTLHHGQAAAGLVED